MSPEHRALVERIRAAAVAVRRAAAAVPPDRPDRAPAPGEWSAREALVHLRNVVVLVHGLRLRRLLYETDPLFADYDEAGHRATALRQPEPIDELAETIAAEHEQLARLLARLPGEHWTRQGRHPELGPMSIEFLARRAAEHAEEHAAQVASAARTLTADARG